MSPKDNNYSEDALIERPAIQLFEDLGWSFANCFHEFNPASPRLHGAGDKGESSLGRETKADVVLVSKLKPTLEQLNPDVPENVIDEAMKILAQDRGLMSMTAANRDVYDLLKNGVLVSYLNERHEHVDERVRIMDWDNPENNDFFLASQFWISGEMYTRRADLVGFVNGIPLLFVELKASHRNLKNAFDDNLRDYKSTIPQTFWYNGVILLSNGSKSRLGTVSSEWDHFSEWKRINSEGEKAKVSLETIIRAVCTKERLLDLVENYTVFKEEKNGPIKIVAKNHQYLGVENAMKAFALTLTPTLSQGERENHSLWEGELRGSHSASDFSREKVNYRGGFYFAGLARKAAELRQRQTPAEQIVWEVLRNRQFMNLKFRRQHQIGGYVADFYCHEKKLVIEIDGSVHNKEDVRKRDHKRDAYFRSLGIQVSRFSNEVIFNDIETFLKDLCRAIEESPSPSGRRMLDEGASQTVPSPFGRRMLDEGASQTVPSPFGRRIKDEGASHRRLGVFWHTQGSGKSLSMVFFAQKILRKVKGNWTFVVVTDRNELDDQIYKNFVRCGAIKGKQERAQTSDGLRQLLSEDHRFVFTTIQKFRTEKGAVHPVISDRDDIIVMTDEAHRTQYDVFALNMRNALPKASFIGFTGTPLIAGEEKTREVFGDYVSVYNFKQAVDDKATVRLFYENRKPKVQLVNLSLNEDIQNILEAAELDEAQQRKFEREFSSEYQLITREERLDDVAHDIVVHYMNRGYMGKAMVVAIDKATAVKMYDKVQKYWKEYAGQLQKEYEQATDVVKEEIGDKLIYMNQTDMAVIVSQSQNEVEDLKEKGVDIVPHRRRMNTEDLDEKFKDADDKLRIVFVCGMWMTGFDVPSCSTIYLDKPMKNHTLMQTIARVNRVYGENKVAGLIVDYIGVLHNLPL